MQWKESKNCWIAFFFLVTSANHYCKQTEFFHSFLPSFFQIKTSFKKPSSNYQFRLPLFILYLIYSNTFLFKFSWTAWCFILCIQLSTYPSVKLRTVFILMRLCRWLHSSLIWVWGELWGGSYARPAISPRWPSSQPSHVLRAVTLQDYQLPLVSFVPHKGGSTTFLHQLRHKSQLTKMFKSKRLKLLCSCYEQ